MGHPNDAMQVMIRAQNGSYSCIHKFLVGLGHEDLKIGANEQSTKVGTSFWLAKQEYMHIDKRKEVWVKKGSRGSIHLAGILTCDANTLISVARSLGSEIADLASELSLAGNNEEKSGNPGDCWPPTHLQANHD
jgi:hypothetical protein